VFEVSLLSTGVSFYALGAAVLLLYRSSTWRFSPMAIAGLIASVFVCVLAVGNLSGIGPVLKVEYNGHSYAFANVLITILALVAVLLIERWRRDEVMRVLEYQATHDALTDLPNRSKFAGTLADALGNAEKTDGNVSVFLLDLNHFKDINDTLGHSVGDRLLQELAARLAQQVPQQAMVARFGGDEFALLISGIDGEADAENFGRSILEALWHPFWVDEVILDVGGSIGAAIFPGHGKTPEELLQHADIAMYKAKRQNSGYEVYCPEDDPHSLRSLTLTGDLRRAIDAGELDLVFQPKLNMWTGKVMGAEVLARWQREGHGQVSPDEFIDHAEHCGLIFPLTQWVLDSALQRASQWRLAGRQIEIAVNLSARLLHHAALVPTVASMLRKWDYPANGLALEITENAILADPVHAMETVAQLADLGVKISIDDFGTGYSSLAYLKNLAAHELKIDKSFVLGMEESGTDRTIVHSVISLAHDLGLTVVAEGIETQKSMAMLAEFGCDVAQGFHCGKPMAATEFENWVTLNSQKPATVTRSSRLPRRAIIGARSPRLVPARAVAQKA